MSLEQWDNLKLEKDYINLIKTIQKDNDTASRLLVDPDWYKLEQEYKQKYSGNDWLYMLLGPLIYLYKRVKFYPFIQVLDVYKHFGFTEQCLRNFVYLGDIHNEFNFISAQGIQINKAKALQYIGQHLEVQFTYETMMCFLPTKHDGRYTTKVNRLINSLKNKRSYYAKNPMKFKSEYELIMNKTLEKILEDNKLTEKEGFKLILNLTNGRSESLLLQKMIIECFRKNETAQQTETHFYSSIYELIRLITNRHLFRKEEFIQSDKQVHYGNWKAYQTKRMKEILFPKSRKKK